MDILDRSSGIERDRCDRSTRSDADTGHEAIVLRVQILDRWNQPQIDTTFVKQQCTDRRNVVSHSPTTGIAVQSPRQRTRVEVADSTNADLRHYSNRV